MPPPVTLRAMSRIVLTTFGSLGDLHPFLAIARELRQRGHQAVIATHGAYRGRVESLGIEFAPVRPHHEDEESMRPELRQAMDARRGSEVVLRRLVLPYLRESRDDLLAATLGADLLVGHTLTFAAPLVAQARGIPWVSTTLQPFAAFSAHDPPLTPAVPWLRALRGLGPAFWRLVWRSGARASRPWFRDVDALRAEMGLPAEARHPMFDGASPELHLMLFSRELAAPQPDWPPSAVQTGFPIHDRGEEGEGLPLSLEVFLRQGDPPLVFTLGSSAVYVAGGFYTAAAEAARRLGRRAVLLVGRDGLNDVPGVPPVAHAPAGERVVRVAYAPHSDLLPRALAVVHQGGVGTTGQAMRAGRPMLVVPFSHDQPDNADRLVRRGVARVLPRSRVNAATLASELEALLADASCAERAARLAEAVRAEPGAAGAADALERLLAARAGAAARR
jgi:rhamnosyltransferase subunit B